MKTFLRSVFWLALIVWLGSGVFFPIVAAVAFTTLAPNTHVAGTIVGSLLRIQYEMGLAAGMVALIVLAVAPTARIFSSRLVIAPMVLLVAMIAGTAYSLFSIIPAMEHDRIAAGGVIDAVPADNPNRVDFNRLHGRSTDVFEGILLFGVLTVVLVSAAESRKPFRIENAAETHPLAAGTAND